MALGLIINSLRY